MPVGVVTAASGDPIDVPPRNVENSSVRLVSSFATKRVC
jgi:hypothetical protein